MRSCYLAPGLQSLTRLCHKDVFGWSRIPDNTGSWGCFFCPTPDVQLDQFLHYTPKLGIPVEMVQFLLNLMLQPRFLSSYCRK